MIGSETFIIVALRCTENSTPSSLARCDLGGQELAERGHVHGGGVDHLAGEHRHRLAEHRGGAVVADQLDAQRSSSCSSTADFSLERKSSALMCATLVFESRAPGAHRVRVLAGVLLDRGRRPAVGVALAQHRVDRAALDLVVAGAGVLLVVGLSGCRGSPAGRSPAPAARRWPPSAAETEAEMLGSLMMLASGCFASSPSSASASSTRCSSGSRSGNWAMIRPAREMSRVSTATPADSGVRLDDREERVRRQQRRLVGVGVDDRVVGHA